MKRNEGMDIKTITTLGMLAALAYAAMLLCKVIPPINGFLSFDLKDTVIAIGGFLFGPLSALMLAIVVPVLEYFTVGDTGWIGMVMNMISTAFFVCPAVAIYRRRHKTSSAVVGLLTGLVCLVVTMTLWNYIITPVYYGMPRSKVVAMLPTVIVPFNLVKGVCNGALIMLLYPPVAAALRKAGLVKPSQHKENAEGKRRFNFVPTVISALVLLTAVLVLLAWLEVF